MIYSKTKIFRYLANLVTTLAFLALLIFSYINNKENMTSLFVQSSYYLILLIFVIWTTQAVLFLRHINFSLKLMLKKHWIGISIDFVLTLLVFSSVQVGFKTLSDETNLLSISNSMLNSKTPHNATMAKRYFGNLNVINNEIPKRPLMFPFLVQTLHLVAGFRYQNPFILNFIVMFLFLSGVYIASRHFLDVGSSIGAMLLILSYPVFTIFATSGGFDVLNSVFFMMILAATYFFFRQPSSRLFCFILASLIMFSNIRYESIFFLAALPMLLLFTGRVKWSYLKEASLLIFITPLVTLPYIWQRILKSNAYQNPEGKSVFSIDAFKDNLGTFFESLIDLEYFLPYAGFLSIISILIFAYLAVRILIKRRTLESWQWRCLIVLVATVLLNTAIYLAHFFGVYTHPSSARLFITLSIVFALGPVILKIAKPRWLPGPSLLIISIVCFLFYHPIAVEGRFINTLTGNRRMEHCLTYLSEAPDKGILIISLRPGQFVALGYGSVNFVYANKYQEKVLREIDRHLYSKVIVFQEIEYKSGQPTTKTKLPPAYNLKTLSEIQVSAREFLRIAEVEYTPVIEASDAQNGK